MERACKRYSELRELGCEREKNSCCAKSSRQQKSNTALKEFRCKFMFYRMRLLYEFYAYVLYFDVHAFAFFCAFFLRVCMCVYVYILRAHARAARIYLLLRARARF